MLLGKRVQDCVANATTQFRGRKLRIGRNQDLLDRDPLLYQQSQNDGRYRRCLPQPSRNFAEITAAVGGGRPNKSSASRSEPRAHFPSAEIRNRRSRLLLFQKAARASFRSSSAPDARSRSARNLSFLISLTGNAAECRRGRDRFDRPK